MQCGSDESVDPPVFPARFVLPPHPPLPEPAPGAPSRLARSGNLHLPRGLRVPGEVLALGHARISVRSSGDKFSGCGLRG
jgi:hypothetical protein